MQKCLIAANKLPQKDTLKLFSEHSKEMMADSIECKRALKRHIKDVQTAQKVMFKLSETKIDLKSIETENTTSKQIWDTLESNFAKCLPFIEETIEKWNSRTKLIGNLGQSQSKKQQNSIFNATIV